MDPQLANTITAQPDGSRVHRRPVMFIDMDNTLVDFTSAFPKLSQEILDEHPERDEIPGIFALMDPMPGAVEAVHELATRFDVLLASTAPWTNPSAWQDKVCWVQHHFGEGPDGPLYKRLILTHRKDQLRGDVLIDDRPHANGAGDFVGTVLHFGPDGDYPTWADVRSALEQHSIQWGLAALPPGGTAGQAALAREIAMAAHAGQVDKLGMDYIHHPAVVAAHFDPAEAPVRHAIAWLHDVLEDTAVTARDLLAAGVHPEIIHVVEVLTRQPDQGDDYYERIRRNPMALAVKLADIAHNTDPARTARLDPEVRERLAAKYAAALEILSAPIEHARWPCRSHRGPSLTKESL